MAKLTPRESQILSFVAHYAGETDRAPSQDQIANRLGVSSRRHIGRCLKRLEAKGFVKLTTYRVKGIQVIKQEPAAS